MSEWDAFPAVGQAPQVAPPQPQAAPTGQPRGIRNNNPGNIEDGPYARSLPGYTGSDGRFATFDTPDAGGAAKDRLLGSYIDRGFNTPNKIINRWAPPSENDSAGYARFVAEKVGIGPDDVVTADMIPAISAAIYEMENGSPPPSQASEDWSAFPAADESVPMGAEQAQPETVDQGRWGTRSHPWAMDTIAEASRAGEVRPGDWINTPEGLTQIRSTEVGVGRGKNVGGNVFINETGLAQDIGAGALAASEQIPFSNDLLAAGRAAMRGQSFGEARQDIRDLKAVDRETDQGARNIGGVAGFGLGLLAPGAGYVNRGAAGAQRAIRAAQLGGGYGALYGAGTSDGTLQERAEAGAQGAAIGGLSGGLLQSGIDRLASRASAPASAARRLSNEGVQLTPGMMLQETPIIGPMAKYAEDLASGYVPFIEGARERSGQSLARAVGNRALGPIGERVGKEATTGYEIASDVYSRLGQAYDDVLPRVSAQADTQVLNDLSSLVSRAAADLPADHASRLEKILDGGVVDRFTSGGSLGGQEFKRMETRLREASQRYQRGSVDDRMLADYLDETRDMVRNLIARQNPAEASRIQDINRGYANYARLRRAASRGAAQGREGTFTPGELSNAVTQLGNENQLATRSALMQDLSSDARNILPSSMGNTGSGQRAVIGMAALGGGAMVNPAIPIAALAGGAGLYSAPAQRALNAVYRATGSRATNESVQTLLDLARRNPAMAGVYQRIIESMTSPEGAQPLSASSPLGSQSPALEQMPIQ